MKPRYSLIAAAAVVVVILACGKSSSASAASTSAGPDSALLKRADHARIEGSAGAPVWVIEVSDFQCPFCRQFHEESYDALKRAYVDSGKVRMAYVNFPLSMHHNAFAASESAMCAAAQDKFWPMHDALFTTQKQWEGLPSPQRMFDSLAVAQGVELKAFQACVSSHLTKPLIEADVDRASKQGVESTPTFLIGNMMVTGA
ncbi:MAG: thioredoxin domain-containing protein, partial [Gemmatimonadota bacterium]